ncbi:hypothetical protein P261_00620 [Lachnospiraceae bacterium TWA4]|nr:hypothetical protein P261_00620 [Lachnospiraceae bacterium TWA4]
MKNKIPCSVIQDLLPNYIEQLTSEETSNEVKNHLDSCVECKKVYEDMTQGEEIILDSDQKEIDFLKKTKNKVKKTKLYSLLGAVGVIVAVFIFYQFIMSCPVERIYFDEIFINGNHKIEVSGTCISGGFKKMVVDEKQGILHLSFIGTRKSGLYSSNIFETYQSKEAIKEIWLDDLILWKDGVSISPETAKVYESYHSYIGDMSANIDTLATLDIGDLLGGTYTNELMTDKEPYEWMISSKLDLIESGYTKEEIEKKLTNYGYVIIAEIKNLSKVHFNYYYDNKKYTISVDKKDATDYAGEDIKVVGADIAKLEKLMQKTDLIYMVDASFLQKVQINQTVEFTIINDVANVKGLYIDALAGGRSFEEGFSLKHADVSVIEVGESAALTLYDSDIVGKLEAIKKITLVVTVQKADGLEYTVRKDVDYHYPKDSEYTLHLKEANGKYILE